MRFIDVALGLKRLLGQNHPDVPVHIHGGPTAEEMAQWTDRDYELAMTFGLCEICASPREGFTEQREDAWYSGIRCTRCAHELD